MNISVTPALIEQKLIIRNLLELYLHDFSEFAGFELSDMGRFDYPYLDHYWTEEGRFPFLVRVEGRLAGFALIRRLVDAGESESHVAEFFVVRKYRKTGVAFSVARILFARFPGRWKLTVHPENTTALRFWRNVVANTDASEVSVTIDEASGRTCFSFLTK